MRVVSPKPISCAPAATSRRAISKTRSRGTSPSYGQPKLTLITPSQRRPASRARGRTRSSPCRDSSIERLTFLRLCVSLADRKTLISSMRSRSSSALSSPRSLGTSTETLTSSGICARSSTSRPSLSCGITSARTKLVTSMRSSPVFASSSTSRTLSSVSMTSGSFWKPSRGPTSRMRTRSGSGTLHDPPLVGADADRAVALEHLDVEAPLALVDDLAQRGARHAARPLGRPGDVLDADLEAHRRLPVGELLEREERRRALHHGDHPGGRQDLHRDGAAHVGQQPALDGELVLARPGRHRRVSLYSPRLMADPVAIIGGTGAVGCGLGVRWSRAGGPVIIGSGGAGRGGAGAQERPEPPAAAPDAPIVVLTVPFRSQSETLTNLKGTLREGQLLIDCTVPLAAAVSGRATRMLGVWQGSAAQQAAEMVPDGVRVVAALHTTGAPTLGDADAVLDEDVLVCGDRKADKRAAAELIARIEGLRPVDAGRLEQARIAESITALLIGINARYKTHAGLRVTGLPAELWPQ